MDLVRAFGLYVSKWRKMEAIVEAKATNHNSSLQITTTRRGVVWLDQVSAMPLDTYKVCTFVGNIFFLFISSILFYISALIHSSLATGSWFPKGTFPNGGRFETKIFQISRYVRSCK